MRNTLRMKRINHIHRHRFMAESIALRNQNARISISWVVLCFLLRHPNQISASVQRTVVPVNQYFHENRVLARRRSILPRSRTLSSTPFSFDRLESKSFGSIHSSTVSGVCNVPKKTNHHNRGTRNALITRQKYILSRHRCNVSGFLSFIKLASSISPIT